MLHGASDNLDLYPGLARWWRAAEKIWIDNRSSPNLSLIQQLNYRNKLTDQTTTTGVRVVYSGSGMYLAACRVPDTRVIVDTVLYWSAVSSEVEAHYLTAVLNSPVVTERVRPLQARGQHNPRHFHKFVWKLAIPAFDESIDTHCELAGAATDAERFIGGLDLPKNVRFEAVRRFVREQLDASEIGARMNKLATAVLDGATQKRAG